MVRCKEEEVGQKSAVDLASYLLMHLQIHQIPMLDNLLVQMLVLVPPIDPILVHLGDHFIGVH